MAARGGHRVRGTEMAGHSYRKLSSSAVSLMKAYPDHVQQAAYYLVTVEPSTKPFRHDTLSDAQDTVMAAEYRGLGTHVEVVFTDGSSKAVAL